MSKVDEQVVAKVIEMLEDPARNWVHRPYTNTLYLDRTYGPNPSPSIAIGSDFGPFSTYIKIDSVTVFGGNAWNALFRPLRWKLIDAVEKRRKLDIIRDNKDHDEWKLTMLRKVK